MKHLNGPADFKNLFALKTLHINEIISSSMIMVFIKHLTENMVIAIFPETLYFVQAMEIVNAISSAIKLLPL